MQEGLGYQKKPAALNIKVKNDEACIISDKNI